MRLTSVGFVLLVMLLLVTPAWAGGGGGGGGVARTSVPWVPMDILLAIQLGVAGFAAWSKRH